MGLSGETPLPMTPNVDLPSEKNDNTAEMVTSTPPANDSISATDFTTTHEHSAQSTPPTSRAVADDYGKNFLTLLIGILAFFLASSVAHNSDLWLHLANGRSIAHGSFHGLADSPLTSDPRAAHSGFYDVLCYVVYSLFGGTGLALGKALLIAFLAVLLLLLSRTEQQSWWLAASCAALALLVMSIRLPLQPVTLSYFLLTMALWLVWKRHDIANRRGAAFLPSWQLLFLFVVWVNVDSWFVLGLAVVGLIWLGEILDRHPVSDGQISNSKNAILAGICRFAMLAGVCLLNPVHYRAFALPAEMSWFSQADASATRFAAESLSSPFHRSFFSTLGLTPAGLAYFPLLGLVLFSFVLHRSNWSWRRFLPVFGLAILSVLQVRVVPFFALVAGPVLAWNAQEYIDRRAASSAGRDWLWHGGIDYARTVAFLLLLILLFCAWPGWLQAPPYEPRRWAVEPPPSLERGAIAARDWFSDEGKANLGRGLHFTADTANAFAWFCPNVKAILDPALASAILGEGKGNINWASRMRNAGINHVIIYDSDRVRFFAAVSRLLNDPKQWPLLHTEGYLAVFGWRDPRVEEEKDPYTNTTLDLDRLCFHPDPSKRAPHTSIDPDLDPRPWWQAIWKRAPRRSLELEEASMHLFQAELKRRSGAEIHRQLWEAGQYLSLIGSAEGWTGITSLVDATYRLTLMEPKTFPPGSNFAALPGVDQLAHVMRVRFSQELNYTPPALLYLAIRAARRALAINPEDVQAHLVLGESYLLLLHNTRERIWVEKLPEVDELRRCQASAALNQAVSLNPDLAQAHYSLSRLYGEMGYLDLTLEHLQKYVKLLRARRAASELMTEQLQSQQSAAQKELEELSRVVEDRQKEFLVESSGWKVSDRATKAWQRGLAGTARDILLESNIAAFGAKGMKLEVELLLKTGRARDVRDWVGTEQEAALGNAYHWVRAQAFSGVGNYAQAEDECNEMAGSLALTTPGRESVQFRDIMAGLLARRMLGEFRSKNSVVDLLVQNIQGAEFRNRVQSLAQSLSKEADVTVLRGLLALEEGNCAEAEIAFRTALSVWKNAEAASAGAGLEFNGRIVAQDCLKWLE